jgi:cyclophilin family peptidyl-prolyl cis-trans isomerase
MWELFRDPVSQRSRPQKARRRLATRLEVQALEDRCLLAANASGTLTALAFVDSNADGAQEALEASMPGVSVTLTGTPAGGKAVNVTGQTDANGSITFQNVQPGIYQLSAATITGFLTGSGGNIVISGISVTGGQTVKENLAFVGLAPGSISLRQLLSTSTSTDFPFSSAGSGTASAGPRPNNAPFLKTAIADVSVAKNSADTLIDLAGHFSDPDFTNSQVRFDTSDGPINVQLFDKTAPQTVANFFNYILSHRYDNTIFHRLVSNFVLQGGGFKFQAGPPVTLPAVAADPAVQNEPGASNVRGTLAMAKLGNDPNSATDQFFFNLANNASNLDSQNGGFTVFGQVLGSADQTVLDTLAATHIDMSHASPFDSIPLNNYNGTNFPTDTTAANYLIVQDVAVVSRNESLTYAVLSNSNPTLVTPTITNERLNLHFVAGITGTSTITVQATDTFGATATATFKVIVT